MRNKLLTIACSIGLAGCNVVPPLDCVLGVERPGCHRDAEGIYHYLYTSPMIPAPNRDAVPVGYGSYTAPPPLTFYPMQVPQPNRLQTTCQRIGDFTYCN
jgi:hypothetical protein